MDIVIDPFDGYTTAELQAEIARRGEAEATAIRTAANHAFQRTRLQGAISGARMDLTRAEDEHAKRMRSHSALVALNMNVRPDEIRVAEIALDQANRARTHAQDRLIAAERALDTFDLDRTAA